MITTDHLHKAAAQRAAALDEQDAVFPAEAEFMERVTRMEHTPGPWRWEFNRAHKSMHLVGGRPMFDLTIMDFARWGMGGAVARLRDTAHDGMNIMHRLCDRPDWIAPFPGRAHHAYWCASVAHPDMKLIEAAPDLLVALQELLAAVQRSVCEGSGRAQEKAHAALAKAL